MELKDNNSESFNDNESNIEEAEDSYEKKKSIKRFIIEASIYLVIILCCIFVVPEYVVQRTIVDGRSMTNTLQNKDNLIVNKLSYVFGEPHRFDIVVLFPYGRENRDKYYVKRIIGLPGETIQIKDSDIYINGEVLKDDYRRDPVIEDPGILSESLTLNEDEYFVMGDNRNGSSDSRDFGPVKKKNIDGHVVFRIYPFDSFGFVD